LPFLVSYYCFLLAGVSLLGGWNNWGWGMMGGWPSATMHGWGFGSFGWIGMILILLIPIGFLVLIILGTGGLVRGFSSMGRGSANLNQGKEGKPSPREILQIRYARGEITRDQYLQMLDDMN